MKSQIKDAFGIIQQLPEPASKPEIVKMQLDQVLKIFQDNAVSLSDIQQAGNEEKIVVGDIETQILPRICEVLSFYEISSPNCVMTDNDTPLTPPKSPKKKTVLGSIVKRVAIVVGIL